jgi:hypothetical protein
MNNESEASGEDELFEYHGIVCQLRWRRAYGMSTQWGARIYLPDGGIYHEARICLTKEEAVARVERRINMMERDKETRGTPCPTTEATTD